MNTRVWLVRHGEPAGVRGRCYGKLDVGLSDAGRAQIELAAGWLGAESFAALYASPRLRTIESARIIAGRHACAYHEEPGLCEIDFGDFEGLAYDEIAARYPAVYRQWMESPTEVQFPAGESFPQMRVRVLSAFEAIRQRHQGQTVAIVTHGGVIRIVLASILEMPDRCLFRLAQDYAAMNLIVWLEGVALVERMNARPAP
ncbi:MAG TPA: histidine phosphatase family protein [Bryobacteraceae bacterium]|nr:histidine phosphatase family protein [Bryobacteraceae bacterium]